jgi:hypothetical protein
VQDVDVGASLNGVLVVLSVLGFNVAAIIGSAIAVASRLKAIEVGQAASDKAAVTTAAHMKETGTIEKLQIEKDLGRIEERVRIAENDIDAVADANRDLQRLIDTMLELKKPA